MFRDKSYTEVEIEVLSTNTRKVNNSNKRLSECETYMQFKPLFLLTLCKYR